MSYSSRNRKKSRNGNDNNNNGSFLGRLRRVELIGIGVILLAIFMYMISRCNGPKAEETLASEVTSENNQAGKKNAVKITKVYLYITTDSLNMRKGPHLDSTLVAKLKYGEKVEYLNEQTDFEQTIRMTQDELSTEPWVKIKTPSGEVGWVFGAGIRPYKKKQPASPANEEEENTEE